MVDAAIYLREDTVVAVSTPPGRGAIAILRLSGPQAIPLCQQIFRPRGKTQLNEPRRLIVGQVIDPKSGEVIDDALCVIFCAPHSYTGEDMAEIHGHGSEAVVRKLLEILYALGARAAEPGEFTFRAVRHEKLDLSQAEAVAALIDSKSQLARRLSLRMLDGAFSKDLEFLREAVVSVLIEIETQIEFPDDALDEQMGRQLAERGADLVRRIEFLLRRAVREQRFEQGIVAVIAGRPNVGKSSLFNRLLGRERAIVSPHAGTTRDSIEGTIDLGGWPVTLIDTAGLRETQEEIEAIGVQRSRELLSTSHITLFVFDASVGLTSEDESLLRGLQGLEQPSTLVLVGNKVDLGNRMNTEAVQREFLLAVSVTASAKDESGMSELIAALERQVAALAPPETDSAFLVSARQERVLAQIHERLSQARHLLQDRAPLEICAEELHAVLQDITLLDGTGIVPDIMNTIFSRFCIGK